MRCKKKKRILFSGQCLYHNYYISRELRKLGWKADLLNIDYNKSNEQFYHGEDFRFDNKRFGRIYEIFFFIKAVFTYDIFHFSNACHMEVSPFLHNLFKKLGKEYLEIYFLKKLGKKIVYTNNGCPDGFSYSVYEKIKPYSPCESCAHFFAPKSKRFCRDEIVTPWSKHRNRLADYHGIIGGLMIGYNTPDKTWETPSFYSLDSDLWKPDLNIPAKHTLQVNPDAVKIYHSIANKKTRTGKGGVTVKSTHIYLELIERLKSEGYNIELIYCTNIPSKEVRFYQAQADIIVDMLTFGAYGANMREGLMLGKPCVCYINPKFSEIAGSQLPEFADNLPIISANPDNIYEILKDLIEDEQKRKEIGKRSREFAVKWFCSKNAAKNVDRLYTALLEGKTDREAYEASYHSK